MTSYAAPEQLRPFADNTEFLAMKLEETLLKLQLTSLAQALEQQIGPKEIRPRYALYRPATKHLIEKVEVGQQHYQQLRACNDRRLELSEDTDVPFRQVVENYDLDEIEQEVVWILFFKAVSVVFRRAYQDAGLFAVRKEPDDLVCVGSLLQLLSANPVAQINLLHYFRPAGQLCRRGVVCLERGAANGGSPALETRLYLDEKVRGRVIGI